MEEKEFLECKRNNKEYTSVNIDEIMYSCEQYRKQLIQYCCQYFDCEYEYAEDCVQDAYIGLLENLKKGIEIYNYKAWLYKVVLNRKNKALKDKIKRKEHIFTSNEEKDDILNNTIIYEPDYIENMITDQMIEEEALRIISTLKSEEKFLYIAHYWERKKLKDIAKELKVNYSTIRKRHEKLKEKLLKKIKNFEGD
jgi:RNA polymerase sigma-70 factor (ECF subfamily)